MGERGQLGRLAVGLATLAFGIEAAVVGGIFAARYSGRKHRPAATFPVLAPVEADAAGDDITVYTYGADLYADMLAAISGAQEVIYFETFIWKGDEVGQKFKDALIAAAAACTCSTPGTPGATIARSSSSTTPWASSGATTSAPCTSGTGATRTSVSVVRWSPTWTSPSSTTGTRGPAGTAPCCRSRHERGSRGSRSIGTCRATWSTRSATCTSKRSTGRRAT